MGGRLLVDDNDDLRAMLKASLVKRRHVVIEASNGREVINKFMQSLDLVVTDILMPEHNARCIFRSTVWTMRVLSREFPCSWQTR